MIKIRKYSDDDIPILKKMVFELHQAVSSFHHNLAPADQIIDKYFDHLIVNVKKSSGTFFIAEDKNEIAGYLCLFGLILREEPDMIEEKYSYIPDLYIRPEFQKKGIGKLLIKKAEEYSKKLGSKTIELQTSGENYNAVKFYKKLNFKERIIIFSKEI